MRLWQRRKDFLVPELPGATIPRRGRPLHESVFPARGGVQRQTAIGPQLSLGAKAMRGLDPSHQQSRSDRADRRDLTQPFHGPVFPALGQQIVSHLLMQIPPGVRLLVIDLRPAPHAGFTDLGQLFSSVTLRVHALACAGNRLAPVQSLHPVHDSPQILGDRQVTAGEFLQTR